MKIGFLMLSGWGGYREEKIEIVGMTPKRYRIRALKKTKIAGRQRWLEPGETTLAPQDAVRIEPRPGCDTCGELEGVRQAIRDETCIYSCRACEQGRA